MRDPFFGAAVLSPFPFVLAMVACHVWLHMACLPYEMMRPRP